MRVAFILTIAPKGISGGRYHTLMLAELAAAAGYEVDIYADNYSAMFDLLKSCPAHMNINYNIINVGQDFDVKDIPDVCVLAPDMSQNPFLYEQWLRFKKLYKSSLIFINFETPNWYNEFSPIKRDINLWKLWDQFAVQSDLILSIAKEGMKYAEKYYPICKDRTRHDYGYPAIQSHLIDDIGEVRQERQFLTFARFNWAAHKGVNELGNLMSSRFAGYVLKIVCGQTLPPKELRDSYDQCAADSSMKIEYLICLDDREKFLEIKKSSAILFPSFFEGFGYPPIEALSCGRPCVCFRLPVLEETCGENIIMATPGNWEEFRNGMAKTISKGFKISNNAVERARSISGFDHCSERFNRTLKSLRKNPFNRLLSLLWK